jgi:anti-anti-sigma factor
LNATTTDYRLQFAHSHAVLRLEPGMGNAAWGDIDRVGTELIANVNNRPTRAWLIDLSGLEYMGSALVALVVRLWKAVQAVGGRVVVVCGDGMPQEVLKLAGLDKVWTITATYEEGLKQLGVEPARTTERSGFPVLTVLALLCAGGAGAAFALLWKGLPVDRDLTVAGLYAGAGVAIALSGVAVVRDGSWRRAFAGLVLIAAIAVIVLGVMKLPQP